MENTIASLVDLPKPTGRMPFHLSPDGRQLALGVQRRTQGARGPTFDEWGVPTEMAGSSVVVVDTATGESMQPFPEEQRKLGCSVVASGRQAGGLRAARRSGMSRPVGSWTRGRLSCCGMRLF